MGVALDTLIEFIDNIPAHDLISFPPVNGTIYHDKDYRLDNQGAGEPEIYNLQIQANRQSKKTTIQRLAPRTVAGPVHLSAALAAEGADTIRADFHAAISI
ncbi:hypothetical protein EJ08DRAFT_720106 [Tothia fuscella]|uniref:Uncharacterized protein n=1 Tax=Tothia fuscella TaxID=1048955 RepID=A0A9P4NZD8_9PEZI|nr:hypothetical protein EJ08DRAFT_720106 [Tothia fuscella]